ncbi:hypothetical protein [Streptomyces sp. NPDC048332]|uniref:hypothetical protein n=1 Tax=Streptomyces sp. NPDC048332 TaxID=3154619 RepID=UPI0034339086
MRNPTTARLAVLRAMAREYQGDITAAVVTRLYVSRFGEGDWRGKARQDLAQLTADGLLIRDDSDPDRRRFRFNYAHGGQL